MRTPRTLSSQSLSIVTQERELLVREKGVLESILKTTMEEVASMLEAETLNSEQVRLDKLWTYATCVI